MSAVAPDGRSPHVVNVEALPVTELQSPGETFRLRRRQLGAATGGQKLGCSWIEVPPGKRTWPHHWHWGNEEAMYVLRGAGTLRLGEERHPIRAGDYVTFRCGPEGAHQVINSGGEPLQCLLVSTMIEPDISVYPDSNKIGVYAGAAPGERNKQPRMSMYLPTGAYVEYWAGEDEAPA